MLDEQLRVSPLVAPDVLNPFKQTNGGCLSNVVVALDVQTLDDSCDCWKNLGLMLPMKLQQVARKVSEHDIQQGAVLGWQAIRRARLHEQRHDLVFGNHG